MFTGAVTAGLPSVQEAIAAPNARRDGFLIRFTAGVLGLALLGGVGVALFTGRPWELSSEPALHRVDVDGHWSIELPTLVGAPTGDGKSRLFGSIQYDGIGFQIEDLGEMQGDDLRETFREMLEQPNTPWPNFHFTVEPEIREHEGRSYVFAEQATDDARVAQTYTLADGRHLVSVLVVPLRVSEPWRAVATRVPFTVKWHD